MQTPSTKPQAPEKLQIPSSKTKAYVRAPLLCRAGRLLRTRAARKRVRVPDILRLAKIDNFFGNVSGMVGDALQAFGDYHQVETTRDIIGAFGHLIGELAMNLFVQRINLFILRDSRASRGGVMIYKGIQRAFQHRQGEISHLWDVGSGLKGRFLA